MIHPSFRFHPQGSRHANHSTRPASAYNHKLQSLTPFACSRAESYQRQFKLDVAPLQAELDQRHMAVGDFAFVADATHTRHDACIRLGEAAYLFCNHTTKTMADIRQNPLWLKAQKPFADLSEKFRHDPLV